MLIAAAQPIRLQPSSKWVVDYAENSCRLARSFGEGKDSVLLNLESEAGMADMFVMGNPVSSTSDEVSGRFLPVQKKPMKGESAQSPNGPVVLWHYVSLLPDDLAEKYEKRERAPAYRLGVRPPPIDLAEKAEIKAKRLEFAAKATELEVDAHRHIILETGPLGDAIKAFDDCIKYSLRDWGVDSDVDDKIVRRAWLSNFQDVFTPSLYPPGMAVRGEQSDVKFRILIDATGKVTKCTALSHFKEKSFEQVVCDTFMKRAHFQPAELADGTKVASYWANRVIFRMGR